ncbi:4-diphosphocytidyl-2C-methyl-D-erythritol 2-phosphate synthase [Candidatus Gastranaerophilus sp. (ex Termes propinquus)]|nr:4-diphosphocytidyl-2C-methyl-D-erythritol 2-phosphate synthase [Candidatus Gastranaerophilus sp. (ex Termes propinquus)]
MQIKIKCPAKINLTLKVGKLRPDGFHPIESAMQAISLFDYLTITLMPKGITLSGDSLEIPYDETNLAYKAAKLFCEAVGTMQGVAIDIQKNIPICAGLAGGSADAAGVLYGLNKLNNEPLSTPELLELCQKLGSDLNFCLTGAKQLATGRGELLEEMPYGYFDLVLVLPKNLKISAREAYCRFDELSEISTMPNDLEFALLPHYKELQTLHALGLQMSGSGPAYFIKEKNLPLSLRHILGENFKIFEGLKTVNHGVIETFD